MRKSCIFIFFSSRPIKIQDCINLHKHSPLPMTMGPKELCQVIISVMIRIKDLHQLLQDAVKSGLVNIVGNLLVISTCFLQNTFTHIHDVRWLKFRHCAEKTNIKILTVVWFSPGRCYFC